MDVVFVGKMDDAQHCREVVQHFDAEKRTFNLASSKLCLGVHRSSTPSISCSNEQGR